MPTAPPPANPHSTRTEAPRQEPACPPHQTPSKESVINSNPNNTNPDDSHDDGIDRDGLVWADTPIGAADHSGPASVPAGDGDWWSRLVDRIETWWVDREPAGPALRDALRIPPRRATVAILATLAAVASIAVAAVWWLVAFIVNTVVGIGDSARHAARTAGSHVTGWSFTRTITTPVQHYLSTHAAGLPIPAPLLWWTWLATTTVLFVLAVAGSCGARIGWTLTGALTVAMVYTATPHPAHTVAAGLTITAWSVLSIAAFNRTATRPRFHLALNLPPRRPVIPAPTGDARTD